MRNNKFIIDTDIGSDIDDALALLLCLKVENFPLKAITTVYNCAELRAKIAKKLEGLGMLDKTEMRLSPSYYGIEENGIDLLIQTIQENPKNIEIISLGQFTNIATALIQNAEISDQISRIWSMSAGISFIDPIPEGFPNPERVYKAIPSHNIRCDIKAAKIVLNSKIPITFIGNDVTTQVLFYESYIDLVESAGSVLNQKVMDMARIWLTYRSRRLEQKVKKTCLHDALVVAESIGMNFTEKIPINIKIDEFGGTEVQYNPDSIYEIAYSVKPNEFIKWYLDIISN
ncbi:MAG: nucleoside hydrolase [Candidatus Lokiarchaeota archaeon]